MSKVVTVRKYTGEDQDYEMKMTLRNPIEGDTYDERKSYIKKIIAKELARTEVPYTVSWISAFFGAEGYLQP